MTAICLIDMRQTLNTKGKSMRLTNGITKVNTNTGCKLSIVKLSLSGLKEAGFL